MKMYFLVILLIFSFLCGGCFLGTSEDAALRTVPVTNNPHIVPNYGTFPGIPTSPQ